VFLQFPPPTEELEESLEMRDQRTLFDLTQDGLVIGEKIQRIYPEFDVSAFVSDVRTEMEGQTIYNVTKAIGRVLRQHLPEDYSDALAILMAFAEIAAPSEPTRHPTPKVETRLRPISHFVSLYGLADFDASLDAFCELSKHRCSRGGEIREFIIKDPNRCFERFGEWVNDENANLRLFVAASLCTRGTWQKWLRPFIQDPQPILALLERLKDDPDVRVREQVATDMRDIIKDYPEAGYTTLERWGQDGRSETKKILRQALKYHQDWGRTRLSTSRYGSRAEVRQSRDCAERAET
jgi:3-methyladenine DNA glycosylase AlkC